MNKNMIILLIIIVLVVGIILGYFLLPTLMNASGGVGEEVFGTSTSTSPPALP
jgi:flagellar basal body-associated protein FliL